jgi:photosystem II stability/assembly factor-like uncharacterized protein
MPPAAINVWTPIGPTGIGSNGGSATGVLFHIAIPGANSQVVYVSSPTSGVWATEDHCASWRDAHGNLPTLTVVGLAVDAGNPDHVYAAIAGDGVYASFDGGGTWVKWGGPSSLPAITELIVDPTDGQHLYLRTFDGIYRSTDGGATWQLLLACQASHLILGPSGGDVLYVGIPQQGIVRSTDAGGAWSLLTPASGAFDIRVAPSAADESVIYARYRITGSLVEFWSSTDGGSTWAQVSTTDQYISVILADPAEANSVYVGGVNLWRSDDGGATWQAKDSPHVDYHMLLFDPNAQSDLYAANDGGLYRSQRAENWNFVVDGVANIEFYDLAVSATEPELTIGGTQDNGTLLTSGSTAHWREITGGDGATVAIDPTNAQVMYAMDQYASSIVRSSDGGATFTGIANGLPGGSAGANLHFGPNPEDPSELLACVGPLWHTEVSNIDWVPIFTPPGAPDEGVDCYAVARDNTYYAGTNKGRIYVGVDGENWELGFAHPSGVAVTDLVVDPNDAATVLYAAFGGGADRVYRFHRIGPPAAVVSVAAKASASRPRVDLSFGLLRALGGATGILTPIRMDNGSTLPAGLGVNSLAVDAMRPVTIYAGTNRGVYRATSTGGTTWTWRDYNAGFPPADVRALRVQASTGVLRAGTFGRSAYEVSTDAPVGSLLNAAGRVTFLRAHDVGTGWGSPPNTLDAEVIVLLDTVPWMSFGFQLREDSERPTREEMLALLRAAFVDDTAISIDYIRTAPRVGVVIRVARVN